jgi:DNA-binding NtrC family response regulator
MNNTLNWSIEQLPIPSRHATAPVRVPVPVEATGAGDRIDALRELVLTLLRELESLRPEQLFRADSEASLQTKVAEFETNLIRQALRRTSGNQSRAARLLGVKHTTLNAKIHRYKIIESAQPNDLESVVSDRVRLA